MNKNTKYKIIISIFVILIIVLLVILNLRKNNNDKVDDQTTKIVSSFYPMYIIAENITDGAQNIELVNMADVNVGCLHDYTLTTEDMKKIENADIFIVNGLGMENFIDKAMSSNENMKVIDSSKNITNIISEDDETNAHIWTSIDNYIIQVKNISEELINLDKENAELYKSNTDEYLNKLEELKKTYLENLKDLDGDKVISLNESFEYLGKELNLDMTTIKTDHEESTLSAEMLKNIIDKVNNEKIKIIIIDKDDNDENAKAIAEETGAKIYKLNSGLKGDLDKDAYIKQVEENMQILTQDD